MYALSGNCHFCPAAPIRRAPAGILGLLHNSCGPNSDKTTSKKCCGSLVLGTLDGARPQVSRTASQPRKDYSLTRAGDTSIVTRVTGSVVTGTVHVQVQARVQVLVQNSYRCCTGTVQCLRMAAAGLAPIRARLDGSACSYSTSTVLDCAVL